MKALITTAALAALFVSAPPSQAATPAATPAGLSFPTLSGHQQKSVTARSQGEFHAAVTAALLPTYTVLPSGTTAAVTFAHGIDNMTLKGSLNTPALLNVTNPAEILPPSLRKNAARCTLTTEGGESTFGNTESRPFFRAGDLSCFDQAGKLVDKAYLIGYLVGDDSNVGLPAHVIKAGMKATFVVKEDGKVFEFSHQ